MRQARPQGDNEQVPNWEALSAKEVDRGRCVQVTCIGSFF